MASVVAAGCTARLIGDILLRGCINALPEDASWFITIAITALLHVRPGIALSEHASTDIHVLRAALEHMGQTWSSAKVLATGVNKLIDQRQNLVNTNSGNLHGTASSGTLQATSDTMPLEEAVPVASVVFELWFERVGLLNHGENAVDVVLVLRHSQVLKCATCFFSATLAN